MLQGAHIESWLYHSFTACVLISSCCRVVKCYTRVVLPQGENCPGRHKSCWLRVALSEEAAVCRESWSAQCHAPIPSNSPTSPFTSIYCTFINSLGFYCNFESTLKGCSTLEKLIQNIIYTWHLWHATFHLSQQRGGWGGGRSTKPGKMSYVWRLKQSQRPLWW